MHLSVFNNLDRKNRADLRQPNQFGNIGKDGIAKKPVDWMSYIRAILMWAIFGLYMWWAFLREK
ncbi:hypothetical protein ACFL7E_01465 [Thermodesulfobacteriota bacterium]